MQSALRVATVVIGLSMLLGALTFIFAPVSMEPHFSIVASRLDGLGTLRGDLGGLFLGLAIFTLYGSRRGNSSWLLVPVVFLLTILFGRILHIAVDGLSQPAIRSTVIEIVGILILEMARCKLGAEISGDQSA